MIGNEEQEAFILARKLIKQATDEHWNYVCLSPFFKGIAGLRPGFEILEHLTALPDEVRHLMPDVFVEIRGTSVQDLRPLAHVNELGHVNFEGTPAAKNDPELKLIASVTDPERKSELLKDWLSANKVADPPEVIEGGPAFIVDDHGPVKMIDPSLVDSEDEDQAELQEECRRKIDELLKIVDLAANVAPDLPSSAQKYQELIVSDASSIGARKIWSVANSLKAMLEIHDHAVENDRLSEELPATVAAKLNDLVETHRVWFLGHPGARDVEQRANRHESSKGGKERRNAAISIVEAAEASSAVADDATKAARNNIQTSNLNSPAGVAAQGELEEWAWNFVASVVRKAWRIAKDPPGGFLGQTAAGFYLVEFLSINNNVLGHYLQNIMSQSPLWWDSLCYTLRRLSHTPEEDQD